MIAFNAPTRLQRTNAPSTRQRGLQRGLQRGNAAFNQGCRRFVASDNTEEGCIGGNPVVPVTYSENVELCDAAGLVLCDTNCDGQGCFYNKYPVRTGVPCGDTEPVVSPVASRTVSPSPGAPRLF